MTSGGGRVLAGADGCKAGWIAVHSEPGEPPSATVFPTFAALLDTLPANAIVAVDMPIGLPDFSRRGGRGPEALVRPILGARQSSVFSIPSRAALYADTSDFTSIEAWYAAHRRASAVAKATSDPPRGVSIQAFGIFAKIREIDTLLAARPDLRDRVFESHPEVAFCRLNDGVAMALPKKIKGAVNPAGMEERKTLLCRCGYDRAFLDRAPPKGAASDGGAARPYPDPPQFDRLGIPVAIWA